MEARECVLNLAQKVSVKIELNDDSSHVNDRADRNDVPSPRPNVQKSFPSNLPLSSCKACKKETPEETFTGVPLTSADEELGCDKENITRRKIRVRAKQFSGNREKRSEEEKIFVVRQSNRLQIRPDGFPAFLCIDGSRIGDPGGVKRKIPRPANAFMLFANEWRKKLAAENPRESNKDISVRLGILWKNMTKDVKEKYFALARGVDAEHKRKYPDYVYNPKEARLRKAMREQSRELSRRSILQSAIARAGAIGGPPGSGGFVDHQHRFGCVSTAALPMSPAVDSDRLSEPWFQSAHRPKPIHSPRMPDWYGNVGDPIERLQAMGAMHRGMENKCKDVMRNQLTAADCGTGFANSGYPTDFGAVNRERELRRQDNVAEYAEFAEGQKWHPYQNGPSPHQHPRTPHPPQMSGILHPNIQNPNSHGHGHGPWGQFCHGVLPHIPTMARNVGIRGPRQAVFLRDRLPNRHCGFSEENQRITYAPSKLDVENVRASYPQPEHQMPRLMESPVDSVIDAAPAARNRRENDEGTRWEPNAINRGISLDGPVPTSTQQEPSLPREKEREIRRTAEKFEPKKKVVSKQPLPGFHQAFGSTEIGRFSRSEYFVNMVGESSGNAEDTENSDVSTDRMSETNGNAAADVTTVVAAVVTPAVTTTTAARTSFDADESEEGTFDDSSNEIVGNASIGSYCGQQPVAPRWHSPHVGAIGSEI